MDSLYSVGRDRNGGLKFIIKVGRRVDCGGGLREWREGDVSSKGWRENGDG